MAKPVLQQVAPTDQKSRLADDHDESKCPARDAGNSAFAGLCLACGIDSSGIQAN